MLESWHAKIERRWDGGEVRRRILCMAMSTRGSLDHLDLSGDSGVHSNHDLTALQRCDLRHSHGADCWDGCAIHQWARLLRGVGTIDTCSNAARSAPDWQPAARAQLLRCSISTRACSDEQTHYSVPVRAASPSKRGPCISPSQAIPSQGLKEPEDHLPVGRVVDGVAPLAAVQTRVDCQIECTCICCSSCKIIVPMLTYGLTEPR